MENVILVATGIFLLVLGYLIGVKGKISMIHSYHYSRVSERDKPAFCRLMGFGNSLIGLGLLLVPVMRPLAGESTALGVMIFCIAAGGLFIGWAIRKYNRS